MRLATKACTQLVEETAVKFVAKELDEPESD
jgi:hypothetical protein